VNTTNERRDEAESFGGARKLIRPLLSAVARRRAPTPGGDPLTHALVGDGPGAPASSHAEAFYFQKQIQQQTEMTVVLEDGEELHGTLEWYDRCAIKLRAGRHRVLVYKSAIKYLYKSSDASTVGTVMR
jgi:host factor-I protein